MRASRKAVNKKRRVPKREPGPDQLFAEMMRLVESAGPEVARVRRAGIASRKVRLGKLEKALSSGTPFDALAKVRELVPDDGVGAQQVVVYGFACILETNSAGLSILFDRFDDDELRKLDASLERIGATRTLAALRAMRRLGAAKLDAQSQVYVAEMEQRLLAFCKAHLPELAR